MTRRACPLLAACLIVAAACLPAWGQDGDLRRWLGPPKPVAPKPVAPAPVKPKPAASPAGDASQDARYEVAKLAFEGLPEPLRKAVQDSLVWTGDFNAVTSGSFGRRTFEGILAWQKRKGLPPTGILSAADRAALDAAGEAARQSMGFTVRPDPASGAVIGVPETLLAKRSALASGPLARGTRWQSRDERITLDTTSYPAGGADLDALFARASTATLERSVTYKLKKPDFFVVTGETPTGRFYIRAAAGPEGIRGFTMSYDKALAGEADRLVIAVANSFVPFPENAQAPATGVAAAPATAFAPPPVPSIPTAPAATGLAVDGGRVLTTAAALAGCPDPRIGGLPVHVATRDPAGALALLALDQASPAASPSPLPPIRGEAPAPDEALVVLGAQGSGAAGVAPGVVEGDGLSAPLQPGAGGAPVLDRSGRLVGLVARFPDKPRLVAGVMPPTRYALVPGGTVAAFLAQAGIAPPQANPRPAATTLGAAAGPVLGSVAAITCGR